MKAWAIKIHERDDVLILRRRVVNGIVLDMESVALQERL